MNELIAQAKAMFDRHFPERQIMQRSCGAVRGLRLSPSRQAIAALGAVGVAGWCVYASASTVFDDPRPSEVVTFLDERAKYDRWLEEFRGRAAYAHELIKQTTREFETARREVEERHAILRSLLEYAHGSRLKPPRNNPNTSLLADIEHAEPLALRTHSVTFTGLRDRLESFLGPAEASAAEAPSAGDEPPDFVTYIRDPDYAVRVADVASRVSAFRRMAH